MDWPSRVRVFARVHWVFLTLLAIGAILRLITQFAYQPALIYWDTYPYLESMVERQPGMVRPFGYSAFLLLLQLENGLEIVPFVQHLLGLAMGLLIYVLLLRLGVRRVFAALAAGPVLLDAFQINLEQQIMSETLFEVLLLGGLALLLWHRRPGIGMSGAAGLVFAAALLTRPNALLIVIPAVMAVFFLRGLRAGIRPAAVLIVAFVTPVAVYAFWFHSYYGVYSITNFQGPSIYARTATIVDCSTLKVPRYERVLCPKEPIPDRLPLDDYIWSPDSPRHKVDPPRGMTKDQVAGDFAKRVILQQPWPYIRAVAYDFIRGFAPVRTSGPKDVAVARWQFHEDYPIYHAEATYEVLRNHGYEGPVAVPQLTAILVPYSWIGAIPGPLFFGCLLAGLAVVLGLGRVRDVRLRTAAFLFTAFAGAVLLPSAMLIFSWRYQLPQFILLPAAGALAATAFLDRRGSAPRDTGESAPAAAESAVSARPTASP